MVERRFLSYSTLEYKNCVLVWQFEHIPKFNNKKKKISKISFGNASYKHATNKNKNKL